MAKRDFLFIDESGEPGNATDYYILGLIHVTDDSLKVLNTQLGAFRYFGGITKELKSTRLNPKQKELLQNILKFCTHDSVFIRTTVVSIRKSDFTGPYLEDKMGYSKNAKKFRHFVLRRLLETHFAETETQSSEVEIVVDRFHSSEIDENMLRSYLRVDKHNRLPNFLHIIQADSRYVELLQIADWATGVVKESKFTHTDRDYSELLEMIRLSEITR